MERVYRLTAPTWADPVRVKATLDADALLAAGEVPLGRIVGLLGALSPGEAVLVLSSFRPAPPAEALEKAGHRVRIEEEEGGRFATTIARSGV
jgi:hypothetical protein